jgi:WD40 repeat protein
MNRGVFSLDFSPDGSKLAVAGGDSSIRILDIVRGGNDYDEK